MIKIIAYLMVFIGMIMGVIHLVNILMESSFFIFLFVLFILFGVVSTVYSVLRYCYRLLVGYTPESENPIVAERGTPIIAPIQSTVKEVVETKEYSESESGIKFVRVNEKWGYVQGEHRQFRLFNTGLWKFGFRIEVIVSNNHSNSVDVVDILLDGKSQLTTWFLEKDKMEKEFLELVMIKLWKMAYREEIPFPNVKELDEFLEEVSFNNYLLKEGLLTQIESEENLQIEYQWVS
ncbi:hypothetical protein [Planococcus maitriensis]|uniref:Uncharacterized protein n=1 Tax=Planococcus maitriensis TaxID=221799 RepID=A0A365KA65_9BACL|nr:hypothetical protein [Planococcus maitriensis]RAZ69656.1 hypothetical protein DP119_03085 [Planococcus maitriensis]